MKCNKCSNELSDETIVCPFCGTPVEDFGTEKTQKTYADQEDEWKEDNSEEPIKEVKSDVEPQYKEKSESEKEKESFEAKEIKYKGNFLVSLVAAFLTVAFLCGTFLVVYRIPFIHDRIVFLEAYASEVFGFPTNSKKPVYEATTAEWTFTDSEESYSCSSSSSYINSNGKEVGPYLVIDSNASTTWFEGVPDDGIGQIVALTYNETRNKKVKEIYFIVGSTRSEESFNNNGVPTRLQIFVNGKENCTVNLKPIVNPQKISLNYPITLKEGTKVEFVIQDVYVGPENSEHDTGISEIRMN